MNDNLNINPGIGGYDEYASTNLHTCTGIGLNNKNIGSDVHNEDLTKKLMDKDKLIINYIKTIKENETKIKTLLKQNDLMEEKTNELTNNITDLSIQAKHNETIINNQKEQLSKLKTQSDFNENQLKKENERLKNTIESFTNKIKLNEDMIKRWTDDNNQLQSSSKNKDYMIEENKSSIDQKDAIIQQLKTENKQIGSLKRQLSDMEEVNNENKRYILRSQGQYDSVLKEKEELLYKLNQITKGKDKISDSELNNNTISIQYEVLQKEHESLKKDKDDLLNKYKSSQKDLDTIVNSVINQIGELSNEIETGFISKMTPNKDLLFINNTKEDVVDKSLSLLKNTISTKQLSFKQQLESLTKGIKELETSNLALTNEKVALIKTNASLTNQNNHLTKKDDEQHLSINEMVNNYSAIKDSYICLKEAYITLTNQMEQVSIQTNTFISNLLSKIQSTNQNSNLSLVEKINKGIDEIVLLNKEMTDSIENYKTNKIILSKEEYSKLLEDNTTLINESINMKKAMEEHKTQLKSEEKELIAKVKELNHLLNESNLLVVDYDTQVKDLKERNKKLENNLSMLTKSHYELEQLIEHNQSHTSNELDDYKVKYNTMLRELELKDIQIQSLEKLKIVEQKQNLNPLIGRIVTRIKNPNNIINNSRSEYNDDDNSKSDDIFIKNEEKEQQLKELFIHSNTESPKNTESTDNNPLHNQYGKLFHNKQQ